MSESFAIGRVAALQPKMTLADLGEGVMGTEDPVVFNYLANVIRVWAHGRKELPEDFGAKLRVTAVSRQPVAFLAVDLEHVTRTLTQVNEPFGGGQYDASRWTSEDPFELVAVPEMSFPPAARSEEIYVPGREEVRTCGECEGAGERPCRECGQMGVVLCPACGGVRQQTCPRCGGTGSTMSISGRYLPCADCAGNGAVRCSRCDVNGHVACKECGGRSRITCASCAGKGNLRSRWMMMCSTGTRSEVVPVSAVAWEVELDRLAGESDGLASVQWAWPGRGRAEKAYAEGLAEELAQRARELVEQAVTRAKGAEGAEERVTGLRFRVAGTYVYEIEFDYQGATGRVYVGGTRCRVFPRQVPSEAGGLLRSIRRMGDRVLTALATDERPGLDPAYVEAVIAGRAHISDSRGLVPAAAEIAEAGLAVSDRGYVLDVHGKNFNARVEVELDVDEMEELVVRSRIDLGPAERDRFPEALAINATLSFGRLAAGPGADGRERFWLVDVRPYGSMDARRYAWVVRAMAEEARDLVMRRALE